MDERYAEGIATGRDEGITISFDRGSHDARVDTARAFLQMGLSPQQVAQGTGLPVDEVRALL